MSREEFWAAESEPVHLWFGLSYTNYLVLHRSLLQSMPQEWQAKFVALVVELGEEFDHLEMPARYDVRVLAREPEHLSDEDCGECMGEGQILRDDDWLPCEDCEGTGQVETDRWETPEEVGIAADPIPHYDRGRTVVVRASQLSVGESS